MKILLFLVFLICNTFGKNALLIIDVQYCFFSNGTNPVPNGESIVPIINNIRNQFEKSFDIVVISQDWHCPDHVSFASQFANKKPKDNIELTYNDKTQLCTPTDYLGIWSVNCDSTSHRITQTLWPDHCVRSTHDSSVSMQLRRKPSDITIHKGWQCDLDAYSVFYNNGHLRKTELDSILKEQKITNLYLVGLAYDFCVYYSAIDGVSLGYNVFVIQDATQYIGQDSRDKATDDMKSKGVNIIQLKDLYNYL